MMSLSVEFRKRSVSMTASVIADVQSKVGVGAFSSYVTDAVQRQLRYDALDEILARMEAEHGPVDDAEVVALIESLTQ